MSNQTRYRAGRGARAAILALVPAVGLAACDFTVTNPGPVEDRFLSDNPAHAGVVNGAGRDLAEAINWIAYSGGAVAREIHPAGSTGSFGIDTKWQIGDLDPETVGTHWTNAQRARWTAEDGIERLKEALGAEFDSSANAAQILVWAGYSNRLLGENMCQAVIDGSAPQANSVYFDRAEGHFTEAIAVAQAAGESDLVTAAHAGRAAVRVFLGDWAGALQDAALVPTDFVYAMPYFENTLDLYNRIHEAGRSQPYRAHTVWATVNEEYYPATKDPRVPYFVGTGAQERGDAAVAPIGRVLFYGQLKYPERTSPINLSSGREMRLIEAEAMIRGDLPGGIAGAVAAINQLRSALGVSTVPMVSASTAEEAWTVLKRERGIELWLEGRRLGDMRRWDEAGAPGSYHPLETVGNPRGLPLQQQDLCFPISEGEAQTNPNIPG